MPFLTWNAEQITKQNFFLRISIYWRKLKEKLLSQRKIVASVRFYFYVIIFDMFHRAVQLC